MSEHVVYAMEPMWDNYQFFDWYCDQYLAGEITLETAIGAYLLDTGIEAINGS